MTESAAFSIDDGHMLCAFADVKSITFVAFDSSGLSADVLRRAKEDLRNWAWRFPFVVGAPVGKLHEWAGGDLGRMTASREATREYMKVANPDRRRAAAQLAVRYWGTRSTYFIADLLKLAFDDPDESVRGCALCSLSLVENLILDRGGQLSLVFTESAHSTIKEAIQRSEEFVAKAKEGAYRKWRALAGQHASHMESSQKAAEHFLDHSDAQLRQAAIQALVRTWQVTSSLGERFEHMLANDSELIVRCEAAHALAWCYRHTDDRRVGKLSANLVHDETVPEKLRRAAYRGLFIVREVSRDVLRRLLFEKRDMFDSEFVESFRKADEPSSEKGGSHDDA